MGSVWLIADTHFHQYSITQFAGPDGVPGSLRPWNTVEDMHREMIQRWNDTVKPQDKIYCMGDMCIPKLRFLEIFDKLHGDKVLIKGNHDTGKLSLYTKYFRDIRAYHVMDRILLAHIPIHPKSLERFRGQIHGHTHAYKMQRDSGRRFVQTEYGGEKIFQHTMYEPIMEDDPRYFCVSVEQINYTPILFEVVNKKLPAEPESKGKGPD